MKSEQELQECKAKLQKAINSENWGIAQIKKNNLTLINWVLDS